MKKILFITWDGPQTSYMEGLFMPIFYNISLLYPVVFEVVQFTWGDSKRIAITQEKANLLGIKYTAYPVLRKPKATLGSIISLFKGIFFLKNYIKENEIDIVMPRSTMPCIMINNIKKQNFKILFDADGLAIEERVDFSGLSKNSFTYKWFSREEKKMLLRADAVITRSLEAIKIHLNKIGYQFKNKFYVVYNGRDIQTFSPNEYNNFAIRKELNCKEDTKVFVYCGSLGPQYGWDDMNTIFKSYLEFNSNAIFLILTGNTSFVQERAYKEIKDKVIIKSVSFEDVPTYLSVANFAFAIREPKHSMKGVAPIKLGEYLLMGIPTIASAGIGDSENIIKETPNCFLWNHTDKNRFEMVNQFLRNNENINKENIRIKGIEYFSIEKSAESYITSIQKIINHE